MYSHVPFLRLARTTPAGLSGLAWVQPPPATRTNSLLPRNATAEAPNVSPEGRLLSADGRPSTTVIRSPEPVILETRAVGPPWYGPTMGTTRQGVLGPPRPASATYRFPCGPNVIPRGPSRPV